MTEDDELPIDLPNPDWGLETGYEFNIDKVQFNNGYTQRAEHGINTALRTWTPTWSVLSTEQADILEAFLVERRGVHPFWWNLPNGERVWVVSSTKVSRKHDAYDCFTISTTLTEEP